MGETWLYSFYCLKDIAVLTYSYDHGKKITEKMECSEDVVISRLYELKDNGVIINDKDIEWVKNRINKRK